MQEDVDNKKDVEYNKEFNKECKHGTFCKIR